MDNEKELGIDLNLNKEAGLVGLASTPSIASSYEYTPSALKELPKFTDTLRDSFSNSSPYGGYVGDFKSHFGTGIETLVHQNTDAFNSYGNVNLERDFLKLKSGKYIPKFENFVAGSDNNERLAWEQNNGQLDSGIWGRGFDRAFGTAWTTAVGGIAGMPYGIVNAINEGSFTAFYDNDLTNWLDEQAEKAKYGGNQIYYSNAENDMSIGQSMGTGKFWADKVLGGAAFTIGTIGSEALWTLATGGASLGAKMATSATQKALSVADKAGKVAKTGNVISKATSKFTKAFKKGTEAISDAKAIGKITGDAVRAGNNAGKLGDVLNTSRFMLTSSAYEAGFEARSMKNESEKAFIDYHKNTFGRMPSSEEWSKFQEELDDSAMNVALMNMALLSTSNLVVFGKMFNVKNPFSSGRAISEGNAVTRKLFGYGVKKGEDGVKTTVKANFLQKGLNKLWSVSKTGATEGVWEEGGQGVASGWMKNYMESTYDVDAVSTSLKNSANLMSPYLKEALSDQYTTKEGAEEMIIGAIIGGIFGMWGSSLNRKGLEESVKFDNNIGEQKKNFIDKTYSQESVLAKVGGMARAVDAEHQSDEAIKQGQPVKGQLKAQETLISMLDSAYSVGKEASFVDGIVADMRAMDANKVAENYGITKEEAVEFIENNAKEVESIAERYTQSRELAERISERVEGDVDKEKVIQGLSYALTMKGNVAEIVKGASEKLFTLFETSGQGRRGRIADLGVLQALVSEDVNQEMINLKNENEALQKEKEERTKELQDVNSSADFETNKDRVAVIQQRLVEIENAIINNNQRGEELVESLAEPIFGGTERSYTYSDLLETFKGNKEDLNDVIEKQKTSNPSLYLEMRDAFDSINEGAEIFNSFDQVLKEFSNPKLEFKTTKKLFQKNGDETQNDKVKSVIEKLGNISLGATEYTSSERTTNEGVERANEPTTEEEIEPTWWKDFVDNGVVPKDVIQNIVNKIKKGSPLTTFEQQTYQTAKEDIENLLKSENVLSDVETEEIVSPSVVEESPKEVVEAEQERVKEISEPKDYIEVANEMLANNEKYQELTTFDNRDSFEVDSEEGKRLIALGVVPTGGDSMVDENGNKVIVNKGSKILQKDVFDRKENIRDEILENAKNSFNESATLESKTTNEIVEEIVRLEATPTEDLKSGNVGFYKTFVNRLSERFNVNVVFTKDLPNNVRGAYDASTNTAYINENNFDGTTVIHEIFGHPFLNKIKTENAELYDSLLKEASKNKAITEYVDKHYPLNERNDEYILRALDLSVKNELLKVAPSKSLLNAIAKLAKNFRDFVKDILGLDTIPPSMTIQEIAEMAVYGKNKLNLAPEEFNGKQNELNFQLDDNSKQERLNALRAELERRKIKLAEVNKKYDNVYLELVDRGILTREQALKEMEKFNRTDSEVYKALKKGVEELLKTDAILQEQSRLIDSKRDEVKNNFGININNVEIPTPEEVDRAVELKSKNVLTEEEQKELQKLSDKIYGYRIINSTYVEDGVSLMDVINLRAQTIKRKNAELNETKLLTAEEVFKNDESALKQEEKRLKGDNKEERRYYEISQVTEDVFISYNKKESDKSTKNVDIIHMSFSDIIGRILELHPNATITSVGDGKILTSGFDKLNGSANANIIVEIDGKTAEFYIPRQFSLDKDGAKSGRPVRMIFNESGYASPEYQLDFLTGITTLTDSTTSGKFSLAYSQGNSIKASEDFNIDNADGGAYDSVAASQVNEDTELELWMTLTDPFNRELHNTTAKEEIIAKKEQATARKNNLNKQKEEFLKGVVDGLIVEDVANKAKPEEYSKTAGGLLVKIFGVPSKEQEAYNNAKKVLEDFKKSNKSKLYKEYVLSGEGRKRFLVSTKDGEAISNKGRNIKRYGAKAGLYYDSKSERALTQEEVFETLFQEELAKREKALTIPDYGKILFESKTKEDVVEALNKINSKNLNSQYFSYSRYQKKLKDFTDKINEVATEETALEDIINDTTIVANDSLTFQRMANVFVVLKGTKTIVSRLKASYDKSNPEQASKELVAVRAFLSSQLDGNNLEARMPVKVKHVFAGTPIHKFENGEAVYTNISENDVKNHGYIKNGTIFANKEGEVDFEDVFIKNVSKNNVDQDIPFVVFTDKISGKDVAYPVILNNETGARIRDKVEDVLNSGLPKGKKASQINDLLMEAQISTPVTIDTLEDVQYMLDSISEASLPISVEQFKESFPTESGIVQTTLDIENRAFTTPKSVLDLRNADAQAYLEQLKLKGVDYFKESTSTKAKEEVKKKCNNGK